MERNKRKSSGPKDDDLIQILGLLPEDDLIQFLIRLPLVYLTQCKPVCKSWLALIESCIFTELYTSFNRSPFSSSKFGSFLLLASPEIKLPYPPSLLHSLYILSYEESRSGSAWSKHDDNKLDVNSSSEDQQQQQVLKSSAPDDKLDVNSSSEDKQQQVLKSRRFASVPLLYKSLSSIHREVVGSCDGLVCLIDRMSNLVSLWNPVTKDHRFLPKPIDTGKDWPHHLVSFGFDFYTSDYKVVILSCFISQFWRTVSPIECCCRLQVYSFRIDSWSLIGGINFLPGYPFIRLGEQEILCLNGICFFMAKFFHTKQQPCFPENDRFIFTFGLTVEEIITTIQLPDHHRDQELYLFSYLDNTLAVFIKSWICDDDVEDYTIWQLNEESYRRSDCCTKQSWGFLSSFKKESGVRSIPRGISNDGEFAILEVEVEDSTGSGATMKLYNLLTKQVKQDFLFCSTVMSKAIPYEPSLVSIIGGSGSSG